MRILIYKQTHIGDPSKLGCWGQTDCMGRVRGLRYDAVIGVGGVGPWPRKERISAKVTWVGNGPSKQQRHGMRGPIVSFKHFSRLEDQGPLVSSVSPLLAQRIYERRARYLIVGSGPEHKEAQQLLSYLLAIRMPPNKPLHGSARRLAPHERCR